LPFAVGRKKILLENYKRKLIVICNECQVNKKEGPVKTSPRYCIENENTGFGKPA
jgi:hypothetical protein